MSEEKSKQKQEADAGTGTSFEETTMATIAREGREDRAKL